MPSTVPPTPHHVVIVGGGIAALEAVLALHDRAGARVRVTLVAPRPDFSLRPLSVLVPFGHETPPAVALVPLLAAHGGAFRQDAVVSVDAAQHVVVCASGARIAYDSLLLAPGARPVAAFSDGLTFDPLQADALSGVVADLEQGWSHSVAFVVPAGVTWPLPLYELALLTAERVWGMGIDGAKFHLVTPEARPLGVFGHEASHAVAELLAAANIVFHGSTSARIEQAGLVDLGIEGPLSVDRIVALPYLTGPSILGLPADAAGFIAADPEGRVGNLPDVWAVGDATTQPIKQGGIACQQADGVATRIAAQAGAEVTVEPSTLVLRGRLLAGSTERFLRRPVGGTHSESEAQPLWWPPAKVASRYLAPYLERAGVVAPSPRDVEPAGGVAVHVPIDWSRAGRADVLGLSTLGPTSRG